MLTRVDFTPQYYEDLIQQKGLRINWQSSVLCPCVDPATSHATPGCRNCDTRGRYYYGSETIKGIITRQNKELQIGDAIGVLEPGEGFLTTSSINKLSMWDKVTNLDSTAVFHETVIHDEKQNDALRYPPVGDVQFAVTQKGRNGLPLQLIERVDFVVDDNGIIAWLGTNKPAQNQGISFRYVHNPVWLVTQTPNLVRDTFVIENNIVDTPTAMPLRVQIKLEYLVNTGV